MSERNIIQYIPAVDVRNMPEEVVDYCIDQDWETHYQNDIAQLCDDGNPFAEWLKANGYVFNKDKRWDDVGIFAT